MSTEIDMNAAVAEIGADLGFEQVEEIDSLESAERKPLDPPAEESTEAATTETTEESKAETEPKKEEAEPAAVATSKPAPRTWRPEAAKLWDGLPDQIKDEIHKREQDVFNGINQYKEAAEFGHTIGKVLEPYQNILKQYNVDVPRQLAGLMHSHATLAFGTAEAKQALMQDIIKTYGIDVSTLGAGKEASYVDPEVESLRSTVRELQSQLGGIVQGKQQELQKSLEQRVRTFAEDPQNKFFNDLMPDMTDLLQRGVAKNIEEAYEKAKYLNPLVRAKVLDEENTRRAQEREKAEKEKLDKAVKATAVSGVVSRQVPGGDTAARGTMDETLEEAYQKIINR